MRKYVLSFALVSVLLLGVFSQFIFPEDLISKNKIPNFNSADISWMLAASAMVLIMTPGLGFFYGGMVQKKNVISTILQSFIAMGIISVVWVIVGFSLAFGKSIGGIIGNPLDYIFFKNVGTQSAWSLAPTIPLALFAVFQMKFAIITPALISGAFAERIRFWGYLLFIILFSLFIYAPLAHAVWHPDGLLFKFGILDFAGGAVVHMSAGWAALAGALFLKKRVKPVHDPSRITYVILGTALLWFGWFGFNAGSAFSSGSIAVQAFVNTTTASATAAISWGFIEKIKGKRLSAMGVCIGAVVGLVAVTPAAGYVSTAHALVIGIIAVAASSWVVDLRAKTNIDDTLDVFPCHGVGGIVGMILTAVFADPHINSAVTEPGLMFGETSLFIKHIVAIIGISMFTFFGSYFLLFITNLITPLRVTENYEMEGLDKSQHGESL
ncbi:ammonium transporter [Halpernia sp. GG3]